MNLRRKVSVALILAGAALVITALSSFIAARMGEERAAQEWSEQERPILNPINQIKPAAPFHPGPTMALLTIENRDLYVVEGAGKSELRKSPGHLVGTALPGDRGNCVIAGHRDTHFRILKNVEVGETISLATKGRRFRYRVTGTRIVHPTDTTSLDPTETASLTLVTCYPFYYVGPAPKRYIIRAELMQ
ncbi:MAG: class D sortase [Bryobacteraceae bacterium]